MVVTFQLLDGSDYGLVLKDGVDPDQAWLESALAVDLARWQ
jgi:hypothetical protein